MSSIGEDEIIKKRLLIEGDSGNEDRLINKLIRNFAKWSNVMVEATSEANDEENADFHYEQMVASLSNVEFGLLRNKAIFDMNKAEQVNYEVLYMKINDEIEKAKKKIVEKKFELQEARKVRKNRQEYDILARQIQNYPDRAEMESTIGDLEEKVEQLKNIDSEYNKKLELRRKQFSVVLQSLSALKSMIETDFKPDEVIRASGINDDAVAPDLSTLQSQSETQDVKLTGRKNGDDIEDEGNNSGSHKREKHYTVNEVEMEDAN